MVHYVKNYLWISSLFLQSCTKTKCHYNVISCLHIHLHKITIDKLIAFVYFQSKNFCCKSWLLQVIICISANCLIICYLVKSTHLIRLWFELQLTKPSAVLFTPENCLMSSIKITIRVPKIKVCII